MLLHELTINQASDKLSKGEITSTELTRAVLRRIEKVEPKIGAYITMTKDCALEMAKASDVRRKAKKTLGRLDGIPIAVKDLFLTKSIRTTAGSKILADFIPTYESTVTAKLWQAGAVLIGKTNLDEFAMGSSTETSAFQTAYKGSVSSRGHSPSTTRNPWDLARVPGGSSGGSAAAVAADECIAAIGTDTGGSIRQPASFCGITGLKPTYGRVSRYGIMAMASSLDQAGPMTKTVEDAAILLEAMAGYDKQDATSNRKTVPNYSAKIKNHPSAGRAKIKELRIGVPKEFFGAGMEADVEEAVRAGIEVYRKMGARIIDVSLPMSKYALAVYYILMSAEASSNLARYDGIHFGYSLIKGGQRGTKENRGASILDIYNKSRAQGFGAEAKRRIMLGSYVLSAGYYEAYYKKAQKVRTLILQEFERVFKSVDLLAAPVSPTPAFKFGEKVSNPLSMYMADIMTVPVNPAGLPALSLPTGFVKREGNNLPVGLQLIGPMWGEERVLKTGHIFQQETDWHLRKATID